MKYNTILTVLKTYFNQMIASVIMHCILNSYSHYVYNTNSWHLAKNKCSNKRIYLRNKRHMYSILLYTRMTVIKLRK